MLIKNSSFTFPFLLNVIDLEKVFKTIDLIEQELQELIDTNKILQEEQKTLKRFVRHAPAAIAMLDQKMRYLVVSDRWSEDFQLKDKNISSLIRQKIRASDILARLGEDEFGLLFYQCPPETARTIADQIRQAIQDFDFIWEDRTFNIGVSIGIVALDSTANDLDSLLNRVDAACYTAKRRGRNCVHVMS